MAVRQPTGVEAPPMADHDSSILDLAFGMDTTSSMSSYIHQAQQNIRTIVEQIVANEKSDVRLALVEYRDHPPQDSTFVTRTNDFTSSVKTMKGWLDKSSAQGGGDTPEAVADGLHQVLKLSWREEATKICVFISDAPPHGLLQSGDGFPNGCPNGLDPVEITNQLAEKGITLYCVGCEPAIASSRDFFMALAHITGGQYVPLGNASLLSKVIIGGAQEEISLQRLMAEVNQDVLEEMERQGGEIDQEALNTRIHTKLQSRGAVTNQLNMNNSHLPEASAFAQGLAKKSKMSEWKTEYTKNAKSAPAPSGARGGIFGSMKNITSRKKKSSATPHEYDMLGAMSSPMEASYSVEAKTIDQCQAKRMVSRAYNMNKSKFSK